jgi:hypothetical protein
MSTTKNESLRDGLCAAAAVAVGIVAGLVDFHNNEPQAAVLVLLVLGCPLGFARPRHAWRWGVITALGIPAVYLIGARLGYQPVDSIHPNIFASLIAMIPGLLGVYVGALARRAGFSRSESTRHERGTIE